MILSEDGCTGSDKYRIKVKERQWEVEERQCEIEARQWMLEERH